MSFRCFLNHAATTKLYTLSLHDALPILGLTSRIIWVNRVIREELEAEDRGFIYAFWHGRQVLNKPAVLDRKSTRLNSSHLVISYAVFCLTKKYVAQREGLPHHQRRQS